jgi:hypothetical protein
LTRESAIKPFRNSISSLSSFKSPSGARVKGVKFGLLSLAYSRLE